MMISRLIWALSLSCPYHSPHRCLFEFLISSRKRRVWRVEPQPQCLRSSPSPSLRVTLWETPSSSLCLTASSSFFFPLHFLPFLIFFLKPRLGCFLPDFPNFSSISCLFFSISSFLCLSPAEILNASWNFIGFNLPFNFCNLTTISRHVSHLTFSPNTAISSAYFFHSLTHSTKP